MIYLSFSGVIIVFELILFLFTRSYPWKCIGNNYWKFFYQVQQQIKTAHINDQWPLNDQINFVKQNGSQYGSTHFFCGKHINIDWFFFSVITLGLAELGVTLCICFNHYYKQAMYNVLEFPDKKWCKDNYILMWLPLNYL